MGSGTIWPPFTDDILSLSARVQLTMWHHWSRWWLGTVQDALLVYQGCFNNTAVWSWSDPDGYGQNWTPPNHKNTTSPVGVYYFWGVCVFYLWHYKSIVEMVYHNKQLFHTFMITTLTGSYSFRNIYSILYIAYGIYTVVQTLTSTYKQCSTCLFG